MLRVGLGGVGLLVDGNQTHLAHQAHHSLSADLMPLPPQPAGHLPGAVPRWFQKLLVHHAHQFQIQLALALGPVIERRPAQPQQIALPHYAQALRMLRRNLPFPPIAAQRPEALAKKSRSMVN